MRRTVSQHQSLVVASKVNQMDKWRHVAAISVCRTQGRTQSMSSTSHALCYWSYCAAYFRARFTAALLSRAVILIPGKWWCSQVRQLYLLSSSPPTRRAYPVTPAVFRSRARFAALRKSPSAAVAAAAAAGCRRIHRQYPVC